MVGAAAGAAVAHHRGQEQTKSSSSSTAKSRPQYAPPPADPADELEHLAQLHTSGVLTDEEFASAKAKVLGS